MGKDGRNKQRWTKQGFKFKFFLERTEREGEFHARIQKKKKQIYLELVVNAFNQTSKKDKKNIWRKIKGISRDGQKGIKKDSAAGTTQKLSWT